MKQGREGGKAEMMWKKMGGREGRGRGRGGVGGTGKEIGNPGRENEAT